MKFASLPFRLVSNLCPQLELSLEDLRTKFKRHTITATLQVPLGGALCGCASVARSAAAPPNQAFDGSSMCRA